MTTSKNPSSDNGFQITIRRPDGSRSTHSWDGDGSHLGTQQVAWMEALRNPGIRRRRRTLIPWISGRPPSRLLRFGAKVTDAYKRSKQMELSP